MGNLNLLEILAKCEKENIHFSIHLLNLSGILESIKLFNKI